MNLDLHVVPQSARGCQDGNTVHLHLYSVCDQETGMSP